MKVFSFKCCYFVWLVVILPITYDVILYLYKEYLNYSNSFVRKRSDQIYVTTH